MYIYRTRFSCAELQDDPIISPEPYESEKIWVTFAYGFVAVTIINLSSIGGLMIVPLMNKRAYHRGRFSFTPLLTYKTPGSKLNRLVAKFDKISPVEICQISPLDFGILAVCDSILRN